MPRHYSSKDFFRLMPNALLARYFHQREKFLNLDFTAMKEARPDALFDAWIALPDDQRSPMEADFRDILGMSDEKGFRAISDEAAWHLEDDAPTLAAFMSALSALEDHGARAMTAFLDHPDFWKGATRFQIGRASCRERVYSSV